jgi:hypothetical protein
MADVSDGVRNARSDPPWRREGRRGGGLGGAVADRRRDSVGGRACSFLH